MSKKGEQRVRIRVVDRLALGFYALIGICLSAGFGFAAVMPNGLTISAVGYTITVGGGFWPSVSAAALALALLVWSVYMLVLAFRGEPKPGKEAVSVQNTENGVVRISIAAMDTLVRQAVGHTDGVTDVHTAIINHEDSISVQAKMTLDSDVHIPNVTMLLQRTIKNYIEEYSGIAVRDVYVMVEKINEITPQPQLAIEAGQSRAGELPPAEESAEKEEIEPQAAPAEAEAEAPVPEEGEAEEESASEPEPEPAAEEEAPAPEEAENAEPQTDEAETKEKQGPDFSEKDIW